MRIGILGAGAIGATLVRRLSTAGHAVKVANSRGPETIDPGLLTSGARAVEATEAVVDVDVLITSIPFHRMADIAPLIARAPRDAVVIDTSNYYPRRDGGIPAIDDGQVESAWVAEQLGRPVAKAWNAITAQSFADRAAPQGAPERIAIPVAADREADRAVVIRLVEETGFDAYDAGAIEDSWRFQPAAPAYCTDLTTAEMSEALSAAQKDRIPRRRDLAMELIAERAEGGDTITGDFLVQFNRAVYR
ncbi:NADP oxidoreductase [Brachybacterium phenoliresistens]|uniref:NADP oxidoreductase n=1 Tax=Brachybacterium phenoliresistens TaxID=396014 RepID=Z9JSB5_9MICO|nr:NADP oxidoreductase [Brachybacterium phenoliresistens]